MGTYMQSKDGQKSLEKIRKEWLLLSEDERSLILGAFFPLITHVKGFGDSSVPELAAKIGLWMHSRADE